MITSSVSSLLGTPAFGSLTQTRFFEPRTNSPSYKAFKKPYDDNKKTLFCEMVKYGEIRALLSGVTTIQGTSPGRNLKPVSRACAKAIPSWCGDLIGSEEIWPTWSA